MTNLSWSKADDALKCLSRVQGASSAYRLNTRDGDMLRHEICGL